MLDVSKTTVFVVISVVGGGGASALPKAFICRKSGQNPWKSEQKWPPTFGEKHIKTFFGGHTKKRSSWLLWEIICRRSHTKTFWASLGKFGHKFFAPSKICLLLNVRLSVREILVMQINLGIIMKRVGSTFLGVLPVKRDVVRVSTGWADTRAEDK